jgi:hypothetical protein
MPLKIKYIGNDLYAADFENVISFWNILKYLVETPYLKHFLIENYEGGNTLVGREAWKEEGIMFKEVTPGMYFFPYESVGFVLDDSVHNMILTIVDHYTPDINYKKENELVLTIRNTDWASIEIPQKQLPVLIALYLLSFMKIGFDRNFVKSLAVLLENVLTETTKQLEYIKSSFIVTLKGIDFIIRVMSENRTSQFYKINYYNKRCRKESLKENKVKSLSYLKKKILRQNKYFPALFYLLSCTAVVLLFILNKKIFFILAVIFLICYFALSLIKKNAYRFFSKGS